MVISTSFGCNNQSFNNLISNGDFEINSSMITAAQKVCEKNGGLKSFEAKKEKESAYFFCKKQGFLEVTESGKIQTVRNKVQEVKTILDSDVAFCQSKCSSVSSIAVVNDKIKCSCSDNKSFVKE